MMLLLVGGVRGLRTQSAANGWVIFGAPTEAHSLHQLLAFANIQSAILALHLAQETIVDEGGCLSWWGGTYCWPMPCRRNGWFGGHRPPIPLSWGLCRRIRVIAWLCRCQAGPEQRAENGTLANGKPL